MLSRLRHDHLGSDNSPSETSGGVALLQAVSHTHAAERFMKAQNMTF